MDPSKMVDPIPQALVLTAIVIGLGVTALALALAIRVYGHYKTLDTRKIRGLKW
jgi:multicomponent Na+:H+ antiporter subunit C